MEEAKSSDTIASVKAQRMEKDIGKPEKLYKNHELRKCSIFELVCLKTPVDWEQLVQTSKMKGVYWNSAWIIGLLIFKIP